MNRIHGFHIDMLRLCFEIEEPSIIDYLAKLEPAEKADFYDFYLIRIEGKHFEYVYEIRYNEFGEDKLFGELRFGINRNEDEANTHTNGTRKAWISVSNRIFILLTKSTTLIISLTFCIWNYTISPVLTYALI